MPVRTAVGEKLLASPRKARERRARVRTGIPDARWQRRLAAKGLPGIAL